MVAYIIPSQWLLTSLKALANVYGINFPELPYFKKTATSLLGQEAAKLKTAPRTSGSSC